MVYRECSERRRIRAMASLRFLIHPETSDFIGGFSPHTLSLPRTALKTTNSVRTIAATQMRATALKN